ncbi:hypothetical protein IAD21_03655 [Abditibacteriota bacterium]|nr:hypothetical protein IAD21_03655 [Abditibacteriota bacterium]
MKILSIPLLCASLLLTIGLSAHAQPVPVSITVQSTPRQTFAGLGTSLGNWGMDYQKLQPTERAQMSKLLWGDLKMKTLRLWLNLNEYAPTSQDRTTANFRARYIDSGIIADARKNGVVHLLLAPDGAPDFLKVKREGGGSDFAIPDDKLADYAGLIAEFIAQIQRETGILIDVTGFQNEPNDLDRLAPDQMAPLVKFLRAALDGRGLKTVQLIGPESANVDGIFYEALDKLRADPQAWQALSGIASHSYAMGATKEGTHRIEDAQGKLTKSYWMTEASANGAEVEGDTLRAASLASRFLSDMNQGVTHWVHFLGFEVPDPKDNATRILAFQNAPFRLTTFQKYWTYHQLSATFDVGATFRYCTSSLDGDMVWTYGKKPHLNASAARNRDGSWSIALSNFTSPAFNDNTDDKSGPTGNGYENGFKAQTYMVKVVVPELATAGQKRFKVMRSQSNGVEKAEGNVEMHAGEIEIPVIGPLELLTLRSP